MQMVIAGQGSGRPLAVRTEEVGHRIVGYDIDLDRVRRLSPGRRHGGG
ncbi:hypothetical protein [Streptomyces sp. WAC06614]|nr:hypothetical protein [Streptomyces sp. WAC06614]